MMLAPAKISAQEGCDVLPHCADNGMDLGTNLPFYYVIFPNGDNTFDIYLRANFCINTEPEKYEWCYTIMHNGVGEYVETGTMDVLGGAGIAEFLHVPDLCDRTVFFTVRYGTNMPYYNCKRLPCPPKEECNRCELKYPYYTDVQTVTGNSSTWFLCDGWIDPNENIVPHDFINVNTYPGIGVPDDDDKIVFTDNNCHTNPDEIIHRIYFPPGIWVADDCEHHGDATVIANTLDPSLLVFPVLHYSGMRIAVEGSVQMSLDYNFDNCDICMHEGARIVSTSTNLQFTNQTLVHDVGLGQPNPPCDFKGWYAIVIQSGKVTASNSRFTGAYAALTRETGQAGTPQVNLQWCTFDRNYTSMAVRSPCEFPARFFQQHFWQRNGPFGFPRKV